MLQWNKRFGIPYTAISLENDSVNLAISGRQLNDNSQGNVPTSVCQWSEWSLFECASREACTKRKDKGNNGRYTGAESR